MFCDTHASVYFLRLASVPALHLTMSTPQPLPTLTSIASPGLNGSKSIVMRAFSAASLDSSRIRAFALRITSIRNDSPFVRFLQLNVLRIRFDVERKGTDVVWGPLLRSRSHLSHLARKIGRQHLGRLPRHSAYEWI